MLMPHGKIVLVTNNGKKPQSHLLKMLYQYL